MKILVIEDDPMVMMIHHEFLKQVSEQDVIFEANSLQQAKDVLERQTVDLILLDNYLPDGIGVTFLEQIMPIPTIMITAANDVASVKKALSHGVVDYLVKPFRFERFKQAIDRAKDYHKMLGREKVSQEMLDYYFVSSEEMSTDHLPKGLAKITLKKVVATVLTKVSEFTTQQIADELAISRITVKKYLNYLVEKGFLAEDAEYLTIGRPVSVYTILDRHQLEGLLENA